MKKIVISILVILGLVGVGLAVWALTTQAGHTGHSRASSERSVGHPRMPVVLLPPVSTTTTTIPVATPVTGDPRMTTTTIPKVQPQATTTTTSSVINVSVPTTTTTTMPPSPGSNVTVQTSTTGTVTAPDKTECTSGPDQECVLVTAIHGVINGDQGPTIIISDASGNEVGAFVVDKTNDQTYCLVHWLARASGTVASSSDCSGGPFESSQTTIEFTYGSPSSL